jgi:hypothetical protein
MTPSHDKSRAEELRALAERYEREGTQAARNAIGGYDQMRHGGMSLKDGTRFAADCFAIAAALRALAEQQP